MSEYPDRIERLLSRGPEPGGWGSSDRKPLTTWWARSRLAFPWRLFRLGVWARVRVPRADWCANDILPHRHLPNGDVYLYVDRARDKIAALRWSNGRRVL